MLLNENAFNKKLACRADDTHEHVSFMINELADFESGIQGHRQRITNTYFEVWKVKRLVDAVKAKTLLLEKKIYRLNIKKNERFNRIFEATLTAIGGIALLDFTLNLVSFAHSPDKPTDNFRGISDWVLSLPHDGVINILTVIIVGLTIVAYRK